MLDTFAFGTTHGGGLKRLPFPPLRLILVWIGDNGRARPVLSLLLDAEILRSSDMDNDS